VPVRRPLIVAAAFVLALGAGCSSHDTHDTAPKGRIVEVSMTEMAFTPSSVAVTKGERITFRFVNKGNVVHEAVLGDETFQREHEQLMKAPASGAKADDHGAHQHDESNAVTVGPGATMELTWTAGESGTVVIGCHQPGHYAAGMKAEIRVA
jgi:uncharacterized cupredoxin-like copper-binding protein